MGSCTSEINRDWESAFPSLKKLTPCNYYQILGPVLCGLKLSQITSLNKYRPGVVFIGLWQLEDNNFGNFMNKGYLFERFGYSQGLNQLGVSNERHSEDYQSIIEIVKKEVKPDLGIALSCEDFLEAFDFWTAKSPQRKNGGYQATSLKFKYMCALYVGDKVRQQQILDEISESRENWPERVLDYWFGDFNTWYKEFTSLDRNDLLKMIEKNRAHERLKKLPFYELTT